MAGRSQREVELKLELSVEEAGRVLRHPSVLRQADGEPARRHLRSVYFDSVDRALLHAGLSLRVRHVDGGQRVQTLKAAEKVQAGLFERQEDEVEIEGDAPEIEAVADATLRGALQRAVAGRTLHAVFETDMQRTTQRQRVAGERWCLDLDVGEVRAGGLREPLCELELELLRGRPRRLYEAALELLADVPLTLGFVSKAARGYALARGARARQPIPEVLDGLRKSLAGVPEARRAELERELEALEARCAGARRDEDLAALHRSREFARLALELGRLSLPA